MFFPLLAKYVHGLYNRYGNNCSKFVQGFLIINGQTPLAKEF